MKVCKVTSAIVDGKLEFTIVEPIHEVPLSEIIKSPEYQKGLQELEYVKKLMKGVKRFYPQPQRIGRLID